MMALPVTCTPATMPSQAAAAAEATAAKAGAAQAAIASKAGFTRATAPSRMDCQTASVTSP